MSVTDPIIGAQLGDYRIIEILGRGGMARVYRGYDARLDRYAAIKIIDAHLVTDENEEEYRQRFLREARAIAKLNHPRIVGIYQFGQSESIYYMAMAFIEGRDLGQILRDHAHKGTRMAPGDILRIIADVADALDHAHHEEVIHRDVKPSNVMVTSDGHGILTDFGLALSVPEGTIGNTFGSAHYIAPEQAVSSANAVPQSDLYSLGVVLYQMFAGKVPFDDPSAMSVALKHLSDPPPPPSQFNADISPAVEAVILKTLEKDPAARYATGVELVAALRGALGLNESDTASRPAQLKTQTQPAVPVSRLQSLLPSDAPSSPSSPSRSVPPYSSSQLGSRPSRPDTPPKLITDTKPTLSEFSRPKPLPIPEPQKKSNVGIIAAVIAGGIILAVLAAFALSSGSINTPTPTPPPTGAAVAQATQESTAAVAPVEAAATAEITETAETSEPTEAIEPTETAAPTEETPAVTANDEATPTSVRRASATPTQRTSATRETTASDTEETEPTSTATSIKPAPEGDIILRYDEGMMVLLNNSDKHLDVSGLSFIQTTAEGKELSFRSNQWGDSDSLYALPPNNCFQVWTNTFTRLPTPDYCEALQGWQGVGLLRWFWISDSESATFDVLKDDKVLVTCAIAAGECAFNLED